MLVVIIIGGIYSGLFTATEAAAMAAVYSFFISVFVYKALKFKDVPRVLLRAANTSAMLALYRDQRGAVFVRSQQREHSLGARRLDHGAGSRLGWLPPARQHIVAVSWQFHGADVDHPDHGADPGRRPRSGLASIWSISAS